MTPTVNYVIASYLGDRKFMDPRFIADRWYYLRQQREMLRRLKHNLAQVTVVINTDEAGVRVPEDALPDGAVLVMRPNRGMSYGAYSYAFKTYGGAFSHYLLNEDDYLFTQQDFDSLLIEEMGTRVRNAMLCGAAYPIGPFPVHPAVSCMMCTHEGLDAIARANEGELPNYHNPGGSPYPDAYRAQMAFGHALLGAGLGLEDWLLRWSTAFRMDGSPELATRWFSRRGMAVGNPHSVEADFGCSAMVVSAQCLEVEHLIHTGYGFRRGTIHADGTVSMVPN